MANMEFADSLSKEADGPICGPLFKLVPQELDHHRWFASEGVHTEVSTIRFEFLKSVAIS